METPLRTHRAKRVEIVIEAPLQRRLEDALAEAGVTGWTVLPVLGGSGRSGRWSREGQVGRLGMVAVICLVGEDRVDGLLAAAFRVVERQVGVVSVAEVEVVRGERF